MKYIQDSDIAVDIYNPKWQYIVRVVMIVLALLYLYFVPLDTLLIPRTVLIGVGAFHLLAHVILRSKMIREGYKKRHVVTATILDIFDSHIAWLVDPLDPAPLFFIVLITIIGNNIQHALRNIRAIYILTAILTPFVFIARSEMFGFSWASMVIIIFSLCLMLYIFLLVGHIEHLKNQSQHWSQELNITNSWLTSEVEERKHIEKSLRQGEQELILYRDELEKRVQERTSELIQANEQLKKEIADRKLAEEEARRHQEQLFQADRMATLGTLVAGVAHEINNPITSIMLNSPLLQDLWNLILPIVDQYYKTHEDCNPGGMTYSMLRERVPLLFSAISEGAERVSNIVAELKDFARQRPPEMNDMIDMNEVAKNAVSLLSNMIKKSTHHFSETYEQGMSRFKGNKQRIEQVVINLLVNACQALSGPDKAIEVKTFYDSDTKSVCIEIADQGIGMTPDVLQRIKDPFFTTQRNEGGTGLGLAISDKIIQGHHGSLKFTSEPNKGTQAKIEIPIEV